MGGPSRPPMSLGSAAMRRRPSRLLRYRRCAPPAGAAAPRGALLATDPTHATAQPGTRAKAHAANKNTRLIPRVSASFVPAADEPADRIRGERGEQRSAVTGRSEEHTSELQSL